MFQKFVKLVGGNDHKEESKEQPSQSSSQQAPAAMPKTAEEAKELVIPDPQTFVPNDQRIIIQGDVWKLNHDGDPKDSEHWLKRKMWLTSAGGLFYYSHKHKTPLGRHIKGLTVKTMEFLPGMFAFEAQPAQIGDTPMRPTLLATDSATERDAWLRHIQSLAGLGGADDLNPLDVFMPRQSARMARATSINTVRDDNLGKKITVPAGSGAKLKPVSEAGNIFTMGLDTGAEEEGSPRSGADQESPSRKAGMERRSSQSQFAEKGHTALVLDWDDTIFPTTWVREDCSLNWRHPIDTQLEASTRKTLILQLLSRLLEKLEGFLNGANGSANIFIVTLARRPWITTSTTNFLPGLGKLIEQHKLKVIYAQEYVSSKLSAEYARGDDFKSAEEVENFWTRVKAEAISTELETFHRSRQVTWKNIISLGDSNFERYGTMAAGKEYLERITEGGQILKTGNTAEGVSKDGHSIKLRVKTLKMLSEPTIEELTAEITLLSMWLPHMIRRDSGFDMEIDTTDDDHKLRMLHLSITNEHKDLSWTELAGMGSAK
mmetsp:Transcript_58783/g.137259  ORF Transcript_58783/g.137259 Transcript_58783/m.137259 type:complete len:546 (+) Transcript_58783:153-1790(+)